MWINIMSKINIIRTHTYMGTGTNSSKSKSVNITALHVRDPITINMIAWRYTNLMNKFSSSGLTTITSSSRFSGSRVAWFCGSFEVIRYEGILQPLGGKRYNFVEHWENRQLCLKKINMTIPSKVD